MSLEKTKINNTFRTDNAITSLDGSNVTWTIDVAEQKRMDAFEMLWCRRMLKSQIKSQIGKPGRELVRRPLSYFI